MKTLSLYIHIPFCKTICLYCAFITFANKNKYLLPYLSALKNEINKKSKQAKKYIVTSIYFGGGTPGLVKSDYIREILEEIKNKFNCKKELNIELEANPENINSQKINELKKIGINRFSIGIQSMNKKSLWRVGRVYSEEKLKTCLETLKAKKVNFGLDFIIGMPFQNVTNFIKEIKIALKYKPKHISLYFLSNDTKKINIFIKDSPNEKTQVKIFQSASKLLKEKGFIHYEVSNFAKPGYESKHNNRYWKQQEYFGIGIGSHSFFNKSVYNNTKSFEKYLKNSLLRTKKLHLEEKLFVWDSIMLNLRRKKGIDINGFLKKFGEKHTKKLLLNASKISKNHLIIKTKSLHLTEEGFLFADKITDELTQ